MTADGAARTRVLLADDQAATLRRWRALLEPEFEVIASVANGEALVDAAERLSPDVIVTDISMARMSGLVAAEAILKHHPAARIVFATVHADLALLRKGLAVGAFGYVLKVRAAEELALAIRSALRNELHISRFAPTELSAKDIEGE